ncbi:hypothetical protein M8J76_004794 [Diaphorina citri]|nr:hypothetical protein M8J75_002632 [Diaphorina citri]KAI5736568.1 hypothetical protein M8J76_004794 [Diaphorina citri]
MVRHLGLTSTLSIIVIYCFNQIATLPTSLEEYQPIYHEDTNSELNNIFDAPIEPRQPHDYDEFIAYLSDLLLKGGVSKGNPLLYVEYPQHKDPSSMESSVHNMKRSRYYRKYPWKRQNGHGYEPDVYMCTPSREDVVQLLVALHEAREGANGRTVNFCNRKRPATSIFTNIRFIGRRK